MDILDVRIDNLMKQEILEKVEGFLSEPKFHQIGTINPEFVLEAQKNEKFKNILNNCDLNIADGIGIKFAFWRFGKNLKCRLAGIDLMEEILKMANDRGLGIFLAANKDGLSTWEETRDAILKKYPKLKITGANFSCHPRESGDPVSRLEVSTLDSRFHGNDKCVLFVNFGAPYQELFINSQKNANIELAMGVGGSFDFLTGKVKRAPFFMRQLGLEWLWRLAHKPGDQPRRWKRIWNAVIVFPVKIIFK
jgi:N-acetylglucosaminyldiphosphoundecaprenol N-acetyl-beta-D-mannosaminyltransferase